MLVFGIAVRAAGSGGVSCSFPVNLVALHEPVTAGNQLQVAPPQVRTKLMPYRRSTVPA